MSEVRKIAGGFEKIGVQRGDVVAIIGNNTLDIYGSISACQVIGAIPAVMHANIVGKELESMLNATKTKYVVAEDQQQVDAVLDSREALPQLKRIIYSVERGLTQYDTSIVMSLTHVKELGLGWMDGDDFQKSIDQVKPEHAALVLFNSGTSGNRKPAVLSHKSLIEIAKHLAEVGRVSSADEYLSFMPVALSSNIVCGYVLSLQVGFCMSCPESPDTVLADLREISPSILYGSEYVYKYIATAVCDKMERSSGLTKWCYQRYIQGRTDQQKSLIGEMLVSAPIRNYYGLNRMRWALVGQSSASSTVVNFFRLIGIDLCAIYGTAETSGCVSVQKLEQHGGNDVGYPVEGMEVKVTDSGEILCRGVGLFDGYYNDEQATNDVMRDGWFTTGDIGNVLSDGRVRVVDTKSAIGRLQDGREFHAGVIENEIKSSLYVRDAMVLGDGRDHITACVTLDPDLTSTWADMLNLRYTGFDELSAHPEVCVRLVGEELAKTNRNMDPKQPKISSYIVLHRQFSPEVGELTWTHKPNRAKLKSHLGEVMSAITNRQSSGQFVDPLNQSQVELNIYNLENRAAE